MGVRADKGRSVARYLLGSTGIPGLTWDGAENTIAAPYPYRIRLSTSRKLQNWTDLIPGTDDGALDIAIRYDYGMGLVDEGWVAMTLRDFVPLLTAHYDTHGAHRAQNGE